MVKTVCEGFILLEKFWNPVDRFNWKPQYNPAGCLRPSKLGVIKSVFWFCHCQVLFQKRSLSEIL